MDHPGVGGQPAAGGDVVEAAAPAGAGMVGARAPTQAAERGIVAWAEVAGEGGARRVAWAAALLLMGAAAAGLALFARTLPAADFQMGDESACKWTPADVVALRTASQILLLVASVQVIVATLTILMPAPLIAVFAYIIGWFTVNPATDVLWMVVACHDDETVHDNISAGYWSVRFLLYLAVAVGTLFSLC